MKKNALWYPYTQHKTADIPLKIMSAKNKSLYLEDGSILLDAISSWWCVIHGYNHPRLNKAAIQQIKKMSHVMLGGLSHHPAEQLADKLLSLTDAHFSHVFFSDSGSVGIEVALKMAIQYFQNQGIYSKHKLLAFKNAYHGDTTGAMSVSDPDDGMHQLFHPLLPKHFFLDNPLHLSLDQLNHFFEQHHPTLAACIIEPLLQAAGGFVMYPPSFLNHLKTLCEKYNVLLIYDEVATGFGRTGTLFASHQTNHYPDIMVLGKGLTGGYLGLSATLATFKIFNAFYNDDSQKALMHGPTFTGNPLACAIALESIAIFEELLYLDKIKNIEKELKKNLLPFSHSKIKSIRVLGATGVIEVYEAKELKKASAFAKDQGVWLRPFDKYLYTMPAYTLTKQECTHIINVMCQYFNKAL